MAVARDQKTVALAHAGLAPARSFNVIPSRIVRRQILGHHEEPGKLNELLIIGVPPIHIENVAVRNLHVTGDHPCENIKGLEGRSNKPIFSEYFKPHQIAEKRLRTVTLEPGSGTSEIFPRIQSILIMPIRRGADLKFPFEFGLKLLESENFRTSKRRKQEKPHQARRKFFHLERLIIPHR
ncbi:MAG: hypothetical protein AAB036_06090 [Elusimicrobiota bacterium]